MTTACAANQKRTCLNAHLLETLLQKFGLTPDWLNRQTVCPKRAFFRLTPERFARRFAQCLRFAAFASALERRYALTRRNASQPLERAAHKRPQHHNVAAADRPGHAYAHARLITRTRTRPSFKGIEV